MAQTVKKAQRDGWRHQAEHLALSHTAVATVTLAAADQARRRRSSQDAECEQGETDPASELTTPASKYAELEQQVTRESTIAWTLTDRRETLAARAARVSSADKRIAELETELSAAHEALALKENENHSLQTSLDLIADDNSRLSSYLTERDVAFDEAQSQLKQIKATLAAVEAEREKLAAAVEEANERRQVEFNTLSSRLGTTSARALTAEKLLVETRQSLLACSAEKSTLERELTDATTARRVAEKNLELLQNSLRVKERLIQELEQARSKLIEGVDSLLKTLETRETALARAEEKIKLLDDPQLEAEANLGKLQKKIEELNCQPRNERIGRTVPEGVGKKPPEAVRKAASEIPRKATPEIVRKAAPESIRKSAHMERSVLRRELDKDDWLLGGR